MLRVNTRELLNSARQQNFSVELYIDGKWWLVDELYRAEEQNRWSICYRKDEMMRHSVMIEDQETVYVDCPQFMQRAQCEVKTIGGINPAYLFFQARKPAAFSDFLIGANGMALPPVIRN